MLDLDRMMEASNQFFFMADQIKIQYLFVSRKCSDLIGLEPSEVDPGSFIKRIHPDDLNRLLSVRSKIYRLGGELLGFKQGGVLISTTLRFTTTKGDYINQLVQCYLFYSDIPTPTVYRLQVHTDISWAGKIKYGYHYYMGTDISNFRYPDEKLLLTGNIFSTREFEIIQLASEGLNSEQIAKKLYLSVHTVETHRRNVLKKSGKSSVIELILDLKNRGLL